MLARTNIENDIEILLYNYENYKNKIKILKERIRILENGESILKTLNNDLDIKIQSSPLFKSDIDKRFDLIENCNHQISKYIQIINIIDINLEDIAKDKYFDIVKLKYFEKCTIEDIAYKLDISIATVKRQRDRLLRKIKNNMIPLFL